MPRIRAGPRRALRHLGRAVRARAPQAEEAGGLTATDARLTRYSAELDRTGSFGIPTDNASALAVTAVLVVQHAGHPRLPQTLDALARSEHTPDRLVVVDATQQRQVPVVLAEHSMLSAAYPQLSVVTVPPGTSFADIVDTAVGALPDPGEDVVVALRPRRRARRRPVHPSDRGEWLWLLHEDSAPDADALRRLVTTVATSDRVGIAGCKVVSSQDPAGWSTSVWT